MGFLRRNTNGSTGYHFLKQKNDPAAEGESEKLVTIGNLCEGLQQSSYSLAGFLEEKKNPAKPSKKNVHDQKQFIRTSLSYHCFILFFKVNFLENGPFSVHAPVTDTSYSNLPKEETDILMATYGDEISYQYALR